MQAFDPRKSSDDRKSVRARLDGTSQRRVLVEPEVRPVEVVAVEQLAEQPLQ
jgi:hypothetical protein